MATTKNQRGNIATSGDDLTLKVDTEASTIIRATSGSDIILSLPNATTTIIGRDTSDTGADRLQNKDLSDDNVYIVDPADNTKKIRFDAGSITTANTRVLTMGDGDSVIGGDSNNLDIITRTGTQTGISGKTFTDPKITTNGSIDVSAAGDLTLGNSATTLTVGGSGTSVDIPGSLSVKGGFKLPDQNKDSYLTVAWDENPTAGSEYTLNLGVNAANRTLSLGADLFISTADVTLTGVGVEGSSLILQNGTQTVGGTDLNDITTNDGAQSLGNKNLFDPFLASSNASITFNSEPKNIALFSSIGANTLTVGGATSTTDIPGSLNVGVDLDVTGNLTFTNALPNIKLNDNGTNDLIIESTSTANAGAGLSADATLILDLKNDASVALRLGNNVDITGAFSVNNATNSNFVILNATGNTTATLPSGTTTLASTAYADAVDHDNLTNFVENKHIDHSGVSITGGEGISGGGDITASRALALDINGLTNSSTTLGANDLFAFYDATTDARVEKITFADLEGALNHDSLLNFVANEHIDWTAANSNFSTTGSGALGSHLEFTETGTPITPGTGRNRVFFSNTDGLPYYVNDAGDVIPFGSGSGGGVKNYVLNPDAEVNHTDSVTATNVTVSAETASPLTGTQSFKLSSATNGGTVDWTLDTIDSFDEGRLLRFKVKTGYVSGTASNWSIGVYETGVGYASEQKTISSGNEQVELQFIPKNGSTYTIKATHATTSTDVILIDDIVLTPEQVVVTDNIQTEWESFTPTGSWSTNTTYSGGYFRRVGDSIDLYCTVAITGAPDAALFTLNLPNSLTVDSSKVAVNSNYGGAWYFDSSTSTNRQFGYVSGGLGTNTVSFASEAGNTISNTVPFTWASGDQMRIWIKGLPITEWAGTSTFGANNRVQYLHNFDTAIDSDNVADFGYGSGGQSIVAISSTNADVKKRVRSQVDVQDSFKISLQVSPGDDKWFNANEIFPYMSDGSAKYGMRIENVPGTTTDMDVVFGGDGAAQADPWSTHTTWKWRVLISQNPLGIGAGLHDSTTSGVLSPDAQTIYGAKTFDSNPTVSNTAVDVTLEDNNSTGNTATSRLTFKNSDSGCSGVVGYNTTSSNIFSVANSTGTLQLGSAFSVQIDAQDGLYNITFPSTASHTYATSGYASLGQYSSSNGTLELASLGSIDLVMDVNNNSGGKKVSFRTNGKGGAGTEVASIQDTGLATFTGGIAGISNGSSVTTGNIGEYVETELTGGFVLTAGTANEWTNDTTYDLVLTAGVWMIGYNVSTQIYRAGGGATAGNIANTRIYNSTDATAVDRTVCWAGGMSYDGTTATGMDHVFSMSRQSIVNITGTKTFNMSIRRSSSDIATRILGDSVTGLLVTPDNHSVLWALRIA